MMPGQWKRDSYLKCDDSWFGQLTVSPSLVLAFFVAEFNKMATYERPYINLKTKMKSISLIYWD